MKVAFITAEYPPKSIGGAGISSELIVEGLRDYGHSVDVFALTGEPDDGPSQHEFGHVELPDGSDGRLPNAIGQNYSIYKHLPNTDTYDVVHAYSPEHFPASVLRADVPIVVTFVNLTWACINASGYLERGCPKYTLFEACRAAKSQYSNIISPVAPIVERIGKAITSRADAITVQTEGMKGVLSRCGYSRSAVEVVPNIIDTRFQIPADKNTIRDSRRLVTVGRLVEEKGVFDIIRAFSQLPADVREGWTLEVYGDGPQRDTIEIYLDKHEITSVSLNYSPYEDMPQDVYREAGAVIQGAKWPEPFSRVWLEAMGTGTPIICSDNPSSKCVLEDVAVFYDPFDMETLRQSLTKVMESPELRMRMSEVGIDRASKFMPAEVIPKYVTIYEQITH